MFLNISILVILLNIVFIRLEQIRKINSYMQVIDKITTLQMEFMEMNELEMSKRKSHVTSCFSNKKEEQIRFTVKLTFINQMPLIIYNLLDVDVNMSYK